MINFQRKVSKIFRAIFKKTNEIIYDVLYPCLQSGLINLASSILKLTEYTRIDDNIF